MENITSKIRIKMILALSITFISVSVLSSQVFIANSPQIRPDFIARIKNTFSNTIASIQNGNSYKGEKTASQVIKPSGEQIPKNLIIQQMAKGVYAAEDKPNKKTYMMFTKDAKIKVYEYIIDGKKITLYEPVQ